MVVKVYNIISTPVVFAYYTIEGKYVRIKIIGGDSVVISDYNKVTSQFEKAFFEKSIHIEEIKDNKISSNTNIKKNKLQQASEDVEKYINEN